MRFLSILYLLVVCSIGYGQDMKYLYYSNQNNLSGTLLILNNENAIVSTPFVFYLLDKSRLVIDTLVIEEKRSNFHQVQRISLIDRNTVSVASFSKSMIISIDSNSFQIEKKVLLDKKFKKENGRIDLIQLFPEGIIARSAKDTKVPHKNYFKQVHYYKPYAGKISKENLTPPAPVKSEYLRYTGFGYNTFVYVKGKLFFNFKELNQLYVFSFARKKTKKISLPEVDTAREVNDFYYDYIAGKYYIVNYREGQKTSIYELFPVQGNYTFVTETPYNVWGIIDGHIHVISSFEGKFGHFLIPLKGDVEDIILLDHEK